MTIILIHPNAPEKNLFSLFMSFYPLQLILIKYSMKQARSCNKKAGLMEKMRANYDAHPNHADVLIGIIEPSSN